MNKMRTPKSFKKPPLVVSTNCSQRDSENDIQFEIELCWCIQQLENALNAGKLSQKISDDTIKNLRILKSGSAPLIKKRQVMKAAFGDYRSKMRNEEKNLSLTAKQIKFTPNEDTKTKSSFVKKSAILTSGKDFKFNFSFQNAKDNDINKSYKSREDSSSTINLSTGGEAFKFNFTINDENDQLDLNGLSIKN